MSPRVASSNYLDNPIPGKVSRRLGEANAPVSETRRGFRSYLATQQAGDQHPLHLGRPLADLIDLHIAPVARDRIVLDETVAAVDLNRLVCRALGGLRRVQLAHRREHSRLIRVARPSV